MLHTGKIAQWNDERGFGFISPAEGSGSVFVHITAFPRSDRLRQPRPGKRSAQSSVHQSLPGLTLRGENEARL